MGRKIPAKRHRGIKDPAKQQEIRFQSIKDKINAPPTDPDDQPIPRSVLQLFAFQNKDKNKIKNKKIKKPKSTKHTGVGAKNPVMGLRRAMGESAREFSQRVTSAVRALHTPLTQDQYPVETEEDDVEGRFRDKRKQAKDKKNKQIKSPDEPKKPSRVQRLALKRKEKKQKARGSGTAASDALVYERVPFGEVAHAPPTLKLKTDTSNAPAPTPRPGRRDLLLNKLLKPEGTTKGVSNKVITAAELARRERARLDAVRAYRELKASKHKGSKPAVLICEYRL